MEQRTDITELIPKALGNYWLIFFGGVSVVAVLEFAYHQLPNWSQTIGETSLTPLDVSSSGSILAWCLSVTFLLTAGVSLINSRLGKKYDDPDKGDVWFWTTFALILLSLDMQVQFRETLRALLVHASGTPLFQDGAAWWMTIYAFVFGLIAIRLLLDMWAYIPSFLLFSLSILGVVAAQSVRLGVFSFPKTPTDRVVFQTALEALAALFLFLSFLLFGRRQVLRDPDVALKWFAKVWKQTLPTKPTTIAVEIPVVPVIVADPATPPAPQAEPSQKSVGEPTSEPTTKTARLAGTPKGRPVLLKKNDDDDFSLLNAS